MAAIGKIRSWGPVLVIVIGIGLFAFIAEEAFRSCESSRNNQRQQVGEVLGEKINYEEFASLVDEAQDALKFMGQDNLNDQAMNQLRDQVWQNYVQYKLVEHECDLLGLTVTDDELQAVLKEGTNQMLLSTPFVNQQTGRFDVNSLQQFLAEYKKLEGTNPQQAEQYKPVYRYWTFMEKNLRQQLLVQKYNALLATALLSNPIEAKQSFREESEESQIQLASYPYSKVADKDVKLTDADLKAKYNELKPRYEQNVETRDIKYVDVQILASAADRAALQKEFQGYASNLAAAADPSDVVRKSTSQVPYLGLPISKNAYPADIAGKLDSIAVGQVYGPFEDKQDNSLNLVKLIAKQELPDSVQFRSIQIGGTTPEEAHQRADSVMTALQGGADFATIAKKYGQDGSEQWLTGQQYEYSSSMDNDTKAYLNTLMTAAPNELRKVTLTQGDVIVQVLKRGNMVEKYTAAVVKKNIEYSKDTHSAIFNKFSSFASANQTPESIEKNAAKYGYKVQEQKDVQTAQHYLAGIASTHDAMKWLFDAKEGQVSQMYECGNNGDNLLIVICEKIHPIGYRGLDDPLVRDEVRTAALNDKKAELLIAKAKNVKNIAGAQKAGAVISTVNQVTFSAPVYVQATGASEPALSGAVYATKVNAFSSHPVKGVGGVYQFQVVKRSKNGSKYNEAEQEQKMVVRSRQFAQSFMNELYLKAKVVDNRYLFFN